MKFEPIYPADYRRLKPYARNQPHQLCVYSLPCVLVWRNEHYHPEAAELDNLLLVAGRFPGEPRKNHLILPFAPQQGPIPPEHLWHLARAAGFHQYHSVPQTYVDRFAADGLSRWFDVRRQNAFDDYIYRQRDLAELRGNRFAKKRNLIHQFQREYEDTGRVSLEALQARNRSECLDFLEEWCLERDCAPQDNLELACEKQAATHMLNEFEHMEVQGLVARVDGEVQAFGIGTRLTVEMGVLHFEKAAGGIKGLYQFFDRECARRLFADSLYINKESDMGVPGLAKAKKSYHPAYQVKAYTLQLKSPASE